MVRTTAVVGSLKERSRVHSADCVTRDNGNSVAVLRENHSLRFQKSSNWASTASVQRPHDDVRLREKTHVRGKMVSLEKVGV
jgi:hypothetical protein